MKCLLNKLFHIGTKYSKFFDFTFYVFIILFASIYPPKYNMLLKMLTVDSLFSAYNFMKLFVQTNISESQIIVQSNNVYTSSAMDRYIFYFLQFIGYKVLTYSLFITDNTILYYSVFLTLIPSILNRILADDIYNFIKKKKEHVVRIILTKQLAYLIKLFSRIYLDKEISVKYNELLPLLKNYKESIQYMIAALKNAALMILLVYIKNYSSNFYYKITKYIYNYKSGEILVSFNSSSAKQMLIDIIDKKKWHELQKPNVYKAILYLYQINEEQTDLLKDIVLTFNYKLLKMLTIWSISSFAENHLIGALLSLFFLLYKKDIYLTKLKQVVVIIAASLLGYFYANYLLVSFICQFGSLITFNKITYNILHYICKSLRRWITYSYNLNRVYLLPLIINLATLLIWTRYLNEYLWLGVAMHSVNIGLMTGNYINTMAFNYLLVLTYFSNYDLAHSVFNTIVIYFLLSLDGTRLLELISAKFRRINRKIKLRKLLPQSAKQDKRERETCVRNESINFNSYIDADEIFDLPNDKFINAISTESKQYKVTRRTEDIEIIDLFKIS